MEPGSPDHTRKAREIFEQVVDLSAEERDRVLQEICGEDEDLHREVEALLEASLKDGDQFSKDLQSAVGLEEMSGRQVDDYVLKELIGEGGFGSVWLAEQLEPVHRKVAVKFLKLGMDSKEVLTRFEAERQALAQMQHPGIAQVYDAGTTKRGRPYFVMEYVPGEPLNQFCTTHRLPLPERLHLFTEICSAIQHAHQKGIIHRDLKPGNILVHFEDRPEGRQAVAKVIDFGVAKALSTPFTEKTLFTGIGQLIGTPVYMSPEQAELGASALDTRSDIYSLGVMLYELVTGFLPFDQKTFKQVAVAEIQRVLREVDPPKPSTRLRQLQKEETATVRTALDTLRIDYRSLASALRSDLDWVILKCLEKDRNRRYETANGLALDIERFLRHEPLQAGPPTTAYRVSKYIRRHRLGLAAASLVLLALVAGLVGTTIGFINARQARIAEAQQRQAAEARAAELQIVTDFQRSVFDRLQPEPIGATIFQSILDGYEAILTAEDSLPEEERQERLAVLRERLYQLNPTDLARQTFNDQVLAQSSRAIDEQFGDQPLVEAALRESLAQAFLQIGLPAQARGEQERAVALRRAHQGATHPQTIEANRILGEILIEEKYYSQAREVLEATLNDAARSPETLQASLYLALGQALYRSEEWEAAERHINEACQRFKESLGPDDPLTVEAELEAIRARQHFFYDVGYMTLIMNRDGGNLAVEQEPAFKLLLERALRLLGEDHPLTWKARMYYLNCLSLETHGDPPENRHVDWSIERMRLSMKQLEALAASQERILGRLHPRTLQTRKKILYLTNRIQDNPRERRKYQDMMEDVIQTELEIWGENNPNLVESLVLLSDAQSTNGFPEESFASIKRAIRIHKRLHPQPGAELCDLYSTLSFTLYIYQYAKEALEAIEECLRLAEEADIPDQRMAIYHALHFEYLMTTGKYQEAEKLSLERRPEGFEANLDTHGLWACLVVQGRWDEFMNLYGRFKASWEEFGEPEPHHIYIGHYTQLTHWFLTRGLKEEGQYWANLAVESFRMSRTNWVNFIEFDLSIRCGDLEAARRAAEQYEAEHQQQREDGPYDPTANPDFPYGEINHELAREQFLLRSATMWDMVDEREKADAYLREYLDFRTWIRTQADPETRTAYDKVCTGDVADYSLWRSAGYLARQGLYEEAEWHYTRSLERRRWDMDPEFNRMLLQEIIDFYCQWDAVDPGGGHLAKIRPFEEKIAAIDADYAKWRAIAREAQMAGTSKAMGKD